MTQYTIRYRSTDPCGRTRLIVDDEQGTAYLFSGGELRLRCEGTEASGRLARDLERRARWVRVPTVSPYTLGELRVIAAARTRGVPSSPARLSG